MGHRLYGRALTRAQARLGTGTQIPKLTALASYWQAVVMEHGTGTFFSLRPEVAGGMGPSTVLDHSTHPPIISRLHYELDDWLGDCLVQTFPSYLVMHSTAVRLTTMTYTGFRIGAALVTTSELYQEINPEGTHPDLDWLVIHGRPGHDDFGLTPPALLVVSSRALDLLQADGLAHCTVELWADTGGAATEYSNEVD